MERDFKSISNLLISKGAWVNVFLTIRDDPTPHLVWNVTFSFDNVGWSVGSAPDIDEAIMLAVNSYRAADDFAYIRALPDRIPDKLRLHQTNQTHQTKPKTKPKVQLQISLDELLGL